MNRARVLMSLGGLFLVGVVQAGDPHSVVDFFRESGRDATFEGRRREFGRLYPTEEYRGTAQQNERLLGVSRFGDEMTMQGEPTMNLFRAPRIRSTQRDLTNAFGNWAPDRCRTVYKAHGTPWVRIIDSIANRGGTCCGIDAQCDQVPEECMPFLSMQNAACATHDRRLAKECHARWYEVANPCVSAAHRELAESSNESLIAVPVSFMWRAGRMIRESKPIVDVPGTPAGYDWAR